VKSVVQRILPAPLLPAARRCYGAAGYWWFRLLVALGLQRRAFGRMPDVITPRLYSEKIRWRMMYDRRPVLRVFSDRFAVRDFVAAKAGSEYLVPLLGVFDRPERIPWGELSPPFVVKASHGSGWNIFVRNSAELDPQRFERSLTRWLRTNYYYVNREWSYKHVPRRIMIEQFIGSNGELPVDYKVHCFDGEPRALAVCHGRSTPRERWVWHDPSWEVLEVFHRRFPAGPATPPPLGLGEMLDVARALSRELEYVRVDLYCVGDRVYFGELTTTQSGGRTILSEAPETWLGDWWHLPSRADVR
jgi:hypothetical protein